MSYRTLCDEPFNVDGEAVRRTQRRQQGSNRGWKITVEPASDGPVTIRLPETGSCSTSGALCTDDRPLSHALSATVAGPVAISVADARVEEGAGVVLGLRGHAQARGGPCGDGRLCHGGRQCPVGVDHAATSGTLTFETRLSS